jgi:NTE family protein
MALLAYAPLPVFSQIASIHPSFDETPHSQRSFYPYRVLKRPKVALILSGGGARGVAQIGVLKAFERHNIPIDFIAATSLGAVVGGLYASGYSAAELENLALTTNWEELLSLSDQAKRTDLFIDQKLADDRSFLAVRFDGFEPVIPAAISSGQRLTNFLSTQVLQSPYHPDPAFDDMKIPFRAVTTDLISGRRIILSQGSLSEALRASATVPLLFAPMEKDSMQLVDGGLIANIPVDVAKSEGYDIIIAVNSTSGLRNGVELVAPWETADQIMGIMMQSSNEQELKNASVVITPDIGRHLSSDFSGLDTLILEGEKAAEDKMQEIVRLYKKQSGVESESVAIYKNPVAEVGEDSRKNIPDSLWQTIQRETRSGGLTMYRVQQLVCDLYDVGSFKDAYAEVFTEGDRTRIVYTVVPNPTLRSVEFVGCRLIPPESLRVEFLPLFGKPVNRETGTNVLEHILRMYRGKGYSLAKIKSISFDEETGNLHMVIDEGIVNTITVQGIERTQDYIVLREFPLKQGDVFEIGKAEQGIRNINSTKLFEYVYLEVLYMLQQPRLTIRLKELPSQLVRLGMRIDDERNLQGSIDIRDENFHGTGSELGFTLAGGNRNIDINLEYKAHRLFNSYLTFNASGFYSFLDSYLYGDAPRTKLNQWSRERIGEYRDTRYGGRLVFGSQLERLGNVTIEYNLQNARIKSLQNATSIEDRYRLAFMRIGTAIDSKNSYPFPTAGVGLNISYEFAFQAIGSEVGYNALRVMYESFSTWDKRHTFHPKFTFGFADKTMPFGQQFRLGGRESFFGVREDDRRGRQLLLINLEYAYHLPVRLLFETYLRIRYDLGSINAVPEDIKLNTFRHGIGAELAFDSPVGPAMLGAGQSFYFGRDLPDNPLQLGPLLLYFMIGYQF